jgi:hypothetical protein
VFASRVPATILCCVALAGAASAVQWTASRQEANGRASLTEAARRYLAESAADGAEALLVKVQTERGGHQGYTESQVVGVDRRGYLRADRVVLQWVRPEGGEWRVVASAPGPR